jgi:hypothetical protein
MVGTLRKILLLRRVPSKLLRAGFLRSARRSGRRWNHRPDDDEPDLTSLNPMHDPVDGRRGAPVRVTLEASTGARPGGPRSTGTSILPRRPDSLADELGRVGTMSEAKLCVRPLETAAR